MYHAGQQKIVSRKCTLEIGIQNFGQFNFPPPFKFWIVAADFFNGYIFLYSNQTFSGLLTLTTLLCEFCVRVKTLLCIRYKATRCKISAVKKQILTWIHSQSHENALSQLTGSLLINKCLLVYCFFALYPHIYPLTINNLSQIIGTN